MGGRFMKFNIGYEEIIHESADKVTVIKKIKNKEDYVFVVKEINGMDRLTRLFFEREVNALKVLNNNENIVKMYNYEIQNIESENKHIGKIHLEYIDGKNLQEIELNLIEFKDKYNIILDIVNAIEASHSKGIIHRDIKPANIMVEDYQSAKLIDFGISKIKGMITNNTVGTVANMSTNKYTAPEVRYHSENSSFKSDIYSLGATLYYFLTGEEPPLPEKFTEILRKASGINPKFKDIIAKCICFDPVDRYESITDFKREFLLISKDLLENSNFVISVPDNIYLYAKRKKIIPKSMKKNNFIEKQLPEWFKNSYAFIDSSLKDSMEINEEHDVIIFNGRYKLICIYKNYDEYFLVRELKLVDAKVRNELTRIYMKVEGVLRFYSSSKLRIEEIKNQTYEFASELIDHRHRYDSDENKQSKFDKFFGAWTEYLETDKKIIKETASKVFYKSCKYKDDETIELILDENMNIDEIDFTQETILAYDPEINGKTNENLGYIIVGSFFDIVSNNNKVLMKLKKTEENSKRIPSGRGILVTDYKTSIYVIGKQLKALTLLKKNECECNENLRDIILGFEKPSSIEGFDNITYFNNKLDLLQKEAVKKALCISSVCVIQGPPGTGKTSVIREIINQILKRQKEDFGFKKYRILIVSQSHAAVDHVLEGLVEEDLDSKIIRIGSDTKIIESIYRKYSVEHAHENWINKTIEKTKSRINELLVGYKIDEKELESYVELKRYSNSREYSAEEKIKIYEFQNKYLEDKSISRIISTLIIQYEWIRGLRLAKDSNMRLIENATIVAGTCTGFNSNPIVKNMNFDYVIIDEAAKASVPELLIPLLKGSRLILVGDHNQLPPMLKDQVIKKCEGLDKKSLEVGLFEHLFNNFPVSNRIKLSVQYRMHETIGNMISKVFYEGGIVTGVDSNERKHSFNYFENKQIVWLSTSDLLYEKRKEYSLKGKTFKNKGEISIIKKVLTILDNENDAKDYEIAIITGYSGQKDAINNEIKMMYFKNLKIEVNTVDAYQGRDKDVVIFSTVRSNHQNNIGFQKSRNRINVAFSRAQRLIIIVGDHRLFYNNTHPSNKFPEIVDYIKNHEGCSIELIGVQNEGK